MRPKGLYIIYKVNKEVDMDFDLNALEKEMEAMTKEMSLEEIAAMEKEIVDGFGQSFDEIFGGTE